MRNWVQTKLAIIYGNYFSLDRKFKKNNAIAIIHFVNNEYGGSIKIEMNGITYFFEGIPKIENYKNAIGENVVKKTLKYGGWEVDMQHPNNKL